MGVYTQQLQQLYIAYFKRPADAVGLAQWEKAVAGQGLDAVAGQFAASAEYQDLYQGLNHEQLVNAVYQNLFGRDGEPAGLAYWGKLLDSGAVSLASLPQAMILGATTSDSVALANKTSAATAFTNALDSAAKAAGYSGDAANDIARAWLATVTSSAASLTKATDAMASVLSNAIDAGNGITHGKLVDGYIAGATIFADANGNGAWDEGEAKTVTDAQGNFTLANAKGTLIASGGIDLGTNLPFNGVMTAPEGATVVNPITTLQQTLIQQGQSVDQAQATISKAFGISVANLDFDQRDPLEAAYEAGASAAERAEAVYMQAVAAKIQNLLVVAAQALTGAVAGLSTADAAKAAGQALADAVSHDADGVVSLADTAVLNEVLKDAAALAGATAQQAASIAALAPNFSAIMADTAKAIDAISADTSMNPDLAQARILQVQTATQGTVANVIHAGAVNGSLDQVTAQLTGSNLSDVILATKIGDVVPGAGSDSGAIDIVNGTPTETAPPRDTTPPSAPTALKLEAADDTGSSSSDGVTKLTSGLTITGNAEAGSTVKLYEDDGEGHLTLLGTATATGGHFSVDVSLVDGAHQLVAQATDEAGNIGSSSSALTVKVDTQAPASLQVTDLLDYSDGYSTILYSAHIAAGNSLVQVGGTNGFGTEMSSLIEDDSYAAIDVSAVFANGLKLGNTVFSALNQLFVGTNGYVTFGVGNSSYDASGIAGYTASPMIAAQFDDLDISKATGQSPGGNSAGSNHIYYNVDATKHIVTITWDDVAPFSSSDSSIGGNDYAHGNAYQIRLHWLQNSDFLIELRYESVNWISGNGGLPTAGWTAGDGVNYGEVQGSGTAGMLNLENTSNIDHAGVYVWQVVNGVVGEYQAPAHTIDVDDAPGKIAFTLSATDTTTGDVLTYALGEEADSRFTLVNGNQIKVNADAHFDLSTESTVTLPVLVTDKAGNVLEQSFVVTLFTPPDTVAPTVTTFSPADDATGVAADANIVLTFSEAVQAGSGNFVLVDDTSEGIATNISVSNVTIDGSTVTINPSSDLVAGHSYHLEVAGGVIKDLAGNAFAGIAGSSSFNFTVQPAADTTAPTLVSHTPADNATSVQVDSNIVLTFSEAVQAGSGNIRLVQDDIEGTTIDIAVGSSQVVFNGSTVTINPTADLVDGAHYHVEMASGVITDSANNAYAGISNNSTLNFETALPADTTAPSLVSSNPANNATNVVWNTNVTLTFNEDVKAGSGDLAFWYDNGEGYTEEIVVAVTDATQVSFNGHSMTINLTGDFHGMFASQGVSLHVDSGAVVDLVGNPYTGINDDTTVHFVLSFPS